MFSISRRLVISRVCGFLVAFVVLFALWVSCLLFMAVTSFIVLLHLCTGLGNRFCSISVIFRNQNNVQCESQARGEPVFSV